MCCVELPTFHAADAFNQSGAFFPAANICWAIHIPTFSIRITNENLLEKFSNSPLLFWKRNILVIEHLKDFFWKNCLEFKMDIFIHWEGMYHIFNLNLWLCQTTNWIILLCHSRLGYLYNLAKCRGWINIPGFWFNLAKFRSYITAENHAIRALWGSVWTAASKCCNEVGCANLKMLDTLNVTCSYFMVLILVRGLLNTFQTGSSLKAKWTATAFFGRTGTILTTYSSQHLK